MKCTDFNNKLAELTDPEKIPEDMRQHISTCVACREVYEKDLMLMHFIDEEKSAKVSPFITTRILARINQPQQKPWFVKPALVSVMSAALIILGFASASILYSHPPESDATAIIASEYYFDNNPASQLEEIWLNSYQYE